MQTITRTGPDRYADENWNRTGLPGPEFCEHYPDRKNRTGCKTKPGPDRTVAKKLKNRTGLPGPGEKRAKVYWQVGSVRLSLARLSSARSSAQLGSARLGLAWLGLAQLGSARLGSARLGIA